MERLPYEVCAPIYESLNIDFSENEAQNQVVMGDERFPVVIGGERGGKSWATAAIFLCHILVLPYLNPDKFKTRSPKWHSPDFVIFGPNYREPKVEFEYIEDWLRQLGELKGEPSKPMNAQWRMTTKDNVVITTWSTENPRSIRAINLEGALVVEAGAMEYDAIERIQGRVSSTKGFILYNGTMENANPWYVKWALEGKRENRYKIKTFSLPSWTNKKVYPGGRYDEEILRMEEFYTYETFMTRVAAEPQPPRDRVLREFTEDHIKELKIPTGQYGVPECKIEIWIDPGYLPSAYSCLWVAIWEDELGKFFYIFDELYEQELENPDIIEKLMQNKYWKYVERDGIVIDVSAKRHADGNEPAIEVYRRLAGKNLRSKYWHENALMERIRVSAKQNRIIIDPKCLGLIAECGLGDYPKFPEMHPWKYPSDKDGNITNDKPLDKWNHACKALGYGLLDHLGIVERLGPRLKSWNRFDTTRERKTPKRSYMRRA